MDLVAVAGSIKDVTSLIADNLGLDWISQVRVFNSQIWRIPPF